METRTMTESERVANDCAIELADWDYAILTFGEVTPDELDDIAADVSVWDDEDRASASRMARVLRDEGHDLLSWSSFVDTALDVEVTGTLSGGLWSVSGVALLMTCGGPNVRFHAEGNSIRIDVAWWNDRATRYISCGLVDHLDMIADEMAGR